MPSEVGFRDSPQGDAGQVGSGTRLRQARWGGATIATLGVLLAFLLVLNPLAWPMPNWVGYAAMGLLSAGGLLYYFSISFDGTRSGGKATNHLRFTVPMVAIVICATSCIVFAVIAQSSVLMSWAIHYVGSDSAQASADTVDVSQGPFLTYVHVTFRDLSGEVHSARLLGVSQDANEYTPGMTIVYSRGHPGRAMAESDFDPVLAPVTPDITLGLLGLALLAIVSMAWMVLSFLSRRRFRDGRPGEPIQRVTFRKGLRASPDTFRVKWADGKRVRCVDTPAARSILKAGLAQSPLASVDDRSRARLAAEAGALPLA